MYNIGGTMRLRRRRKFVNHKKRIMYFSLFFLVLFISVGYAYLSRALSINGHTELRANTWNIQFENLSIKEGSVEAVTPAAIDGNTTTINYSIKLARPGNFYEFEVDLVNSGTVGAKLSLVNIDGISSELEPFLKSSINYVTGNPVQVNDLLSPSARKRIVVRVEYSKDDLNNLPEENISLDLELNITYTQTTDKETTTGTIIQQLKAENSSCFTKYEGQVTDQVGQTVEASNVYFNKCADKRNIIFGGYCWQMIRTTETGGIKMIYNGEPDQNGQCGSSRGDHKGIVGANGSTQTLNAEYLYGDSFTYDIINNTFTLVDTTTATWSDSTYQNLLDKFTCKNIEGTCTTLYNVNGYSNSTTAYTSSYTIGDTNYAGIGTSSFNANDRSPAMVGYMFNKVYNYEIKSPGTTEYKYGSGFTYDTNTNTYTLSGTTQNISTWSTGYNTINNTHYTCWNTSGTCNTISYIYHTSSSNAYYFDITEGKNVNDILNEMLWNNDVNRYNSSIKGIVDSWYAQNLSTKTNMLEDTVYCNARNTTSLGGWDPEGSTTSIYYIKFKNYTLNNDISCANETDQFAVSNNKAKLTYPVSLATHEELYTLTNNSSSTYYSTLTKTGAYWWGLSPSNFGVNNSAYVRYVYTDGRMNDFKFVFYGYGVRLVVSLNTGAVITGGTGSEIDPWIIK